MSPVAVTLLQAITKQARIPRDYGRERRLAIAGETRRPLVGGNGCSGPPLPLFPTPPWRHCGRPARLERFPITWNHVIEKESLKFKEVEHALIEKVEQLFRDML